ncbi:MAG: metallophosphoesterase [Spirochaetaceae bacterium]|jgi:Icc-related predicted phosphoesterase|nr:metallophosphoesterase [Spirochaetaceae bacterium]
MKILCIADQIDPLVYTNTIKSRFQNVDLILSAGDLPFDYLDFVASSLNRPLLFVFGNHHLDQYESYRIKDTSLDFGKAGAFSAGLIHIGSSVCSEGGLLIAGLGGSMRYNRGPNQYTERQMLLEIWKLFPRLLFNRIVRGRWLDILLTHAAPRGIHDKADPCHRGFKCFLWFMRTFKPRYFIHGHIHLYDLADIRTTRYEKTTVINAYSQYLITIENDTKEKDTKAKNTRRKPHGRD